MKKSEMMDLSHEELIELSLKKNKRGIATSEAKAAQEILWEIGGRCYNHHEESSKRYGWANRTSHDI